MDLHFSSHKTKKEVHFSKEAKNCQANTGHYWSILLSVFFVLVVVLIGFNVYVLHQINREAIFTVTDTSDVNVPKVNQSRLEAVLDYFDNRAKRAEEVLLAKPQVVDPALPH